MSKNEIITKIEAIRELEELIAEANAEADVGRRHRNPGGWSLHRPLDQHPDAEAGHHGAEKGNA